MYHIFACHIPTDISRNLEIVRNLIFKTIQNFTVCFSSVPINNGYRTQLYRTFWIYYLKLFGSIYTSSNRALDTHTVCHNHITNHLN